MKIYKVTIDISLVIPRLKHISLKEFNGNRPIVFVDAENPDDACYQCYHKFAEMILAQDKNMVKEIKDIFNDITIVKLYTP
tara:strand:- start:2354 stop:2596 length:243 start_codon:yes stop_codon:yes gene_type:complete